MELNWIEWLGYWIVSALALALTAALVPGFRIRGFGAAMIASLVIGIANFLMKPLLILLTLPLTILTLGLFIFVVDAVILRVSAALLEDFEITNWISAILGAVILAITSGLLHWLFI
ncbi:MAG TPA: phage holin family protein [Bdellovibrionales bacterium]|nr:phage holin family protein [Bdellovibrionales bacterium]